MKKLKWVLCAALIAAIIAVDRWSKAAVLAAFSAPIENGIQTADAPRALLAPIIQFTRVHNFGAAWSSFVGARWFLTGISLAGVAVLSWFLIRIVRHPLGFWSVAAVIGGGIGNLIDRICYGYVVDMIDLMFMDYPVFNVADCFIVLGTIGAAIYYFFFYTKSDASRWEKQDGTH